MRPATDVYVPGSGAASPAGEASPWPPSIYVPPSPGAALAGRIRSRLPTDAAGARPAEIARELPSLFRDPDLVGDLQERLAREFGQLDADAVAALEPGGYLLGATLAARVRCPLVSFVETDGPSGGGEGPEEDRAFGDRPLPELAPETVNAGDRVLLVSGLLAAGESLRAAAEQLEEVGARPVGIVVLVELPGQGRERLKDYNIMSILRL